MPCAMHDSSKVATMQSNKERLLTVRFEADTSASMQWNFRPQQKEVKLYAGETALAFYSAKNATAKPIDGISTYNVIPYAAGLVSSILLCFKTVLLAKALGRKQCIKNVIFEYSELEFSVYSDMMSIDVKYFKICVSM